MPHRDIKPAHLGEGSAQKQTKHLKDPLDNTVGMCADSQPGLKARPNRHRDSGQSRPEPAVWLPTVPACKPPVGHMRT